MTHHEAHTERDHDQHSGDADRQPSDATGPAGHAADVERKAAGLDADGGADGGADGARTDDGEIDDGMGADAADDVAGEDEAIPGLDDDPLARAHDSSANESSAHDS